MCQFYLVLDGRATINHDGLRERLGSGEGVEIPAGTAHQIRNDSTSDLEFMVVSTGRPREDRIDLESS
jgi:mannose-6-phosphate isomerase-like protein (cupin superfamily)